MLRNLQGSIGKKHSQGKLFRHGSQFEQQLPTAGRIVLIARRLRQGYGRSRIRGNQMNFGGPSAARPADGLGSVSFFLMPGAIRMDLDDGRIQREGLRF